MKTLIVALLMVPSLYVAHAEDTLFVEPDTQPNVPVATLAFLEPQPTVSCDIAGKSSQIYTLTVRNRKYAGQVERRRGSFEKVSALRDKYCPDDF